MSGILPVRKIYIDSRYKNPSSPSDSDFKYELRESISLPDKCVCFLDDIIIPNSFFNIDQYNNKLYATLETITPAGSENKIITIPENNYTSATLRTQLETTLNSAFTGTSIAITYDSNKLIFSIALDANFKLYFHTDNEIKLFGDSWTGIPIDQQNLNSMNEIITNNNYTSPAVAINPLLTGLIDLRRYHNLYITSPNLSSFSSMAPMSQSVLKKVPITSDYGTIIYDNVVSNHDWIDVSKLTLKTLDFRIVDVHGRTVNLRSAPVSFSMIFMLEQD